MIDTAGLREPQDIVEKIGISKTWDIISKADLVLWVSDATRTDTQAIDPALAARLPAGVAQLRVINKIDLVGAGPPADDAGADAPVRVSAKTRAGMDALQAVMLAAVGWGGDGEGLFMARARHLQALQGAANHLAAAMKQTAELELFAEELKLAQKSLTSITGEFTADDLLGKIFSNFCIGK